jgi:uracil-DNA glycosylase
VSLVDELAAASIGSTFNFYREGEGADVRCARLRDYLEAKANAPLLLVAEAPGYRGSRVSGLPLTSEHQVSGSGPREATATIVHRVLAALGLEDEALLWNVVPTHPHLPGRPDTNRRPTRNEVEESRRFLVAVAAGRSVVAVGRLAEAALTASNSLLLVGNVRHPAHGGGAAFYDGLRTIARHRTRKEARWTRLR